jgi:tyrosine-specific transport protein
MKMISAVMMIVSTSVGIGILGLPIATAQCGFVPTLCAFALAFIFMTLAAFYILEVKMHIKGHASLASMIKLTLGKPGHFLSSLVILLLLYALLSTYLMTAVAWIKLLVPALIPISNVSVALGFILFFILIMMYKEGVLYQINNFLGVIVLFAFAAIVFSSLIPIQSDFIANADWPAMRPAFPLLLTTFGFSIVVPAITEYLHYEKVLVGRAILCGSFISLLAYVAWEWSILGHISFNVLHSFQVNGDDGTGVIVALAHLSQHPSVIFWGKIFAFLLVVTSFLGISLALLHFLGDLFNLSIRGKLRPIFSMVMYAFPVVIVMLFPRAFIQFLSFSGIFVAILLGLFPAWMVLQLKRKKLLQSQHIIYRTEVIFLVNVFFILVIFQEIMNCMK